MLLNLNRALEYMRRCQLDVLVATSPVNITYFSGYYSWLAPLFKEYMTRPGALGEIEQRYAVQPLEGEPALVVSPLFAINAADLWVKDLHFFGGAGLDFSLGLASLPEAVRPLYEHLRAPIPNSTPTDALISILKARRLTGSRIGIEMDGLTTRAKAELSQKLPDARLKDCSNLIQLIRMVKSEEEIRRLTRAAEISEIGRRKPWRWPVETSPAPKWSGTTGRGLANSAQTSMTSPMGCTAWASPANRNSGYRTISWNT
jgi:Xaa-Pro aminopeptidase